MAKYQGHKNWNHWNVSLWISNDEGLYRLAMDYARHTGRGYRYTKQQAAERFLEALSEAGITHTPDGAPYSVSSIRAAMVGM